MKKKYILYLTLLCIFIITNICSFIFGVYKTDIQARFRVANDNSFFPLYALKSIDNAEFSKKFKPLFQNELNVSSIILAELCLKYPSYATKGHYNLLVKINKYQDIPSKKITDAIEYLNAQHDMSELGEFWIGADGVRHKGSMKSHLKKTYNIQ